MKKYLVLTVPIVALALVLTTSTACRTITTTQVVDGVTNTVVRTELDPERTAGAIRALVPAGVAIALDKDPNSEAYLRAAAILLRATAERGEYDPNQVQRTLDTISVKGLHTPEARATIAAALGIYRVYFGDAVNVHLDKGKWAKPILSAIADGIWDALPPLSQ